VLCVWWTGSGLQDDYILTAFAAHVRSVHMNSRVSHVYYGATVSSLPDGGRDYWRFFDTFVCGSHLPRLKSLDDTR
jgi:hypothetical protein